MINESPLLDLFMGGMGEDIAQGCWGLPRDARGCSWMLGRCWGNVALLSPDEILAAHAFCIGAVLLP